MGTYAYLIFNIQTKRYRSAFTIAILFRNFIFSFHSSLHLIRFFKPFIYLYKKVIQNYLELSSNSEPIFLFQVSVLGKAEK